MDALFERPHRVGLQLRHPPSAASLDLVADHLAWTRRARHLTLCVDVGLPEGAAPEHDGRDLTDVLTPVAARFGQVRLDAAFGRKRAGGFSRVRVAHSRPQSAAPPSPAVRTRVTAPATTIDWKQQLHDACRRVTPETVPSGPVDVQLRFTLSRRRDWTALWRPALQALGPVLGVPDPTRHYVAATDRVTSLGLHRALDDDVGPDVLVEVWWQPIGVARPVGQAVGRTG